MNSQNKPVGRFRSRSSSVMSSWGPKSFRNRAQSWSLSRGRSGSFHSKSLVAEADRPLVLKLSSRCDESADAKLKSQKFCIVDRHGESWAPHVGYAGVCAGAVSSVQDRALAIAVVNRNVMTSDEKAWFKSCSAQYVGEMERMAGEMDGIVDRRDYFNGFTALHWAAKFNNKDMLNLCLRYKADLNMKSHGGDTPLHIAAKQGHADVCVALLNAGTNANIRNNFGKLAYQLCHKSVPNAIKEKMLKGVNSQACKTLLNNSLRKPPAPMPSPKFGVSLSSSRTKVADDEGGQLSASSSRHGFKFIFRRKSSTQVTSGPSSVC